MKTVKKRAFQCLVEGDGDVLAIPVLLRKLLHEKQLFDVEILKPKRRGDLNSVQGRLRDYLLDASHEDCLILWVLDFDSKNHKCVVETAQNLERSFEEILPNYPAKVCFIVKEYESLFLANPAALKTVFPALDSSKIPLEPESPRGCKELISKALPRGTAYKERIDQEKITAHLNLETLRQNSTSFRHLEKTINELLAALPAE